MSKSEVTFMQFNAAGAVSNSPFEFEGCAGRLGHYLVTPLRKEPCHLIQRILITALEVFETLFSFFTRDTIRFENIKLILSGGQMTLGEMISPEELDAFIDCASWGFRKSMKSCNQETAMPIISSIEACKNELSTWLQNNKDSTVDSLFCKNSESAISDKYLAGQHFPNLANCNVPFPESNEGLTSLTEFTRHYRRAFFNLEWVRSEALSLQKNGTSMQPIVQATFFKLLYQWRCFSRVYQLNAQSAVNAAFQRHKELVSPERKQEIFRSYMRTHLPDLVAFQEKDSALIRDLESAGYGSVSPNTKGSCAICYRKGRFSLRSVGTRAAKVVSILLQDKVSGMEHHIISAHGPSTMLDAKDLSAQDTPWSTLEKEDVSALSSRLTIGFDTNATHDPSDQNRMLLDHVTKRIQETYATGELFNSKASYEAEHGTDSYRTTNKTRLVTTQISKRGKPSVQPKDMVYSTGLVKRVHLLGGEAGPIPDWAHPWDHRAVVAEIEFS